MQRSGKRRIHHVTGRLRCRRAVPRAFSTLMEALYSRLSISSCQRRFCSQWQLSENTRLSQRSNLQIVQVVESEITCVPQSSGFISKYAQRNHHLNGWVVAPHRSGIARTCFLTTPYLEDTAYMHFCGHQKLTFSNIPLKALSRSEFSEKKHVLRMIQEILQSKADRGLRPIAPITIATYPILSVGAGCEESTIIINGKHRVTATILLHLLATKPKVVTREADAKLVVKMYYDERKLGQKWNLDALDTLQDLFNPCGKPCLKLIEEKKTLISPSDF